MSSELFPKEEILETRTKPRFLTSFFGRGFIFVQYSHQRDAGPKKRTSQSEVRFLFFTAFLFGQQTWEQNVICSGSFCKNSWRRAYDASPCYQLFAGRAFP